jgi:hypothetical protein
VYTDDLPFPSLCQESNSAGQYQESHWEGFWSLLRSWLHPHRGISQEKRLLYLGFSNLFTTFESEAKHYWVRSLSYYSHKTLESNMSVPQKYRYAWRSSTIRVA